MLQITYLETVIPLYSSVKECNNMIKDIDQTDLHRSEPSSRTDLQDEHSYQ